MIKTLKDNEHIRLRPEMYAGPKIPTKFKDFILTDNKIEYKEIEYIPALVKAINEIIDNSVDEAIKTDFKYSTNISVEITDFSIKIEDNGRGIPVKKNENGEYFPEMCWNRARSGSNFDDDKNRNSIGMNGVGSYITNVFSTKFIGITCDGKNTYKLVSKNGASDFTQSIKENNSKSFTKVEFFPDLEYFNIEKIDDIYKLIIKQRLINLSMSFSEINFKFNGKKINIPNFKKYISLFSDNYVIYEDEDYKFAILENESDDFKFFSYVNGLKIPDGGTHIDVIIKNIVDLIREKLVKKYKTIKPGDIKNKLMLVLFIKNFKNPKFNSQNKEKLTNSIKEVNNYYGNIDYKKIVAKILKTKEIIDPIIDIFKIKEEYLRRKELSKLTKKQRDFTDKYLPAINNKKYLLITEGESATGGLIGPLGRKECGFFEIRGKPLNVWNVSHSKFLQNEELKELFNVVKNENYEYIIFATDADLDGIHIRGLLIGFIQKYLEEYKNRVGILNTPVKVERKNRKILSWVYDLNDEINSKNEIIYKKGLGSWSQKDLELVIKKDGLENMIEIIEFDDIEIIDDWLNKDLADKRKDYIMKNDFSIAKL